MVGYAVPRFASGGRGSCRYSGFEASPDYAADLAPYLHSASTERLISGKFCQITHGVRIIASSVSHPISGFSAFLFEVFNPEMIRSYAAPIGKKRDTIIGNDVWLVFESMVMPGVRIGNGAIIAVRIVVAAAVTDYPIVGGTPRSADPYSLRP
ncbi:hypothetical protein ACK6D9_12270 [Hoeflea sp. Naph1]|uniref:hypothetical protein n=1 Tax=Hoeflea sp. Naph1 TaxID=3388653 RepID=UPI0039901FF9